MKDVTFGQYYPASSPIHRLDPRAKLIFVLLYIVFIFFVDTYISYAAIFAFIITVTAIARVPYLALLKSIKMVMFLVIFTSALNLFYIKEGKPLVNWWIITITDKGIDTTIKLAMRLVFLVIGTSLLTFTSTPMEITDGIESLLKPLTYIKVPVHDFALVMSIALRFIPALSEETNKIIMAQKARGGAFDTGKIRERLKAIISILIPLFVNAFRRANELADALDARCYKACAKRTKMKVLKFTYRDLIALIVVGALITLIMLDKYYFKGLDGMLLEWIRSFR